jgi:serine/threonine-protein kinase
VAIKAVANDLVADPEFKIRMQDEAHRHQRLQHPNIVPVLDVFEADGETCIVMALIEGTSLDSFLASQTHNRLEIRDAIPIVRDILNALNYAHQQGIVHRDVKPSNVLLDQDKHAMLIDFGIALAMGEERRTRTGQIVGTPAYMSPEQIARPKSIDHRSDVYSVGCVFYEMHFAIQHAHVTKRPMNPKSRVPSIPRHVGELVMAALEKDPNQRIPGCQEFLRLLDTGPQTSRRFGWVICVLVIILFLLIWLFAQ